MSKEYAVFLFNGSFTNTERPVQVPCRDVDRATEIAQQLTLQYGAPPFAFHFESRVDSLDSIGNRSGLYYLGGTIQTLAEIRAECNPSNQRMIWNLEARGIDKIVTNNCPCLACFPLRDEDQVLTWEPAVESRFGL
ncbi:hypothetical protein CPY51_30470 [Rhizobium tubonense]|uniref:Uncharacterized protein n=1 Tax=Rhizobium tubonense TaxID=484088 RepID=A0A2W4E8N8_9HYPH|nr:hypothetical protein CPY51_30470 [Rhizobium tubonense]